MESQTQTILKSGEGNGHTTAAAPTAHHHGVPRLHDPNQPHGSGHWWLWLIVAAAALGLGLYLYPRLSAKLGAAPKAGGPGAHGGAGREVPVVAEKAKRGDMKIYLDGLGTVTPFNTVTVRTRVDGQIMKINFREGQNVKAGDSLIEIDSRPYEVQLTQAQGAYTRDQAQLTSAQQDLKRYEEAGSSISVQQVEEQKQLVAQYEGALKADQGQIDSAQLNITYCHITSPITGKIGLRLVDLGNIVHATDTTGLVVITQMQPIAVVFSIPQVDIPRVLSQPNGGDGLPALAITPDMQTTVARGKLLAADSQVDPTTGTLKFKASFPNEKNELFPNEFVNVKLQIQELKDVVLVPTVAVQPGLGGPDSEFVYVVNSDDKVELRKVKTGAQEGERTVIESGLEEGETVVTDGVDKLTQGTKVSVRPAGGKGGKNKPGGAATQESTTQEASEHGAGAAASSEPAATEQAAESGGHGGGNGKPHNGKKKPQQQEGGAAGGAQ